MKSTETQGASGKSLSVARRTVSLKLAGVELPACFTQATSASYARILEKKRSDRTPAQLRDARRIRRQERAIERGGL